LPSSQRRAIWVVHPYVLAQLVQLADSGGRIIWVPNNGGLQDHVPGVAAHSLRAAFPMNRAFLPECFWQTGAAAGVAIC
jgi:hypothetical protein